MWLRADKCTTGMVRNILFYLDIRKDYAHLCTAPRLIANKNNVQALPKQASDDHGHRKLSVAEAFYMHHWIQEPLENTVISRLHFHIVAVGGDNVERCFFGCFFSILRNTYPLQFLRVSILKVPKLCARLLYVHQIPNEAEFRPDGTQS
jgi:hypothetical protein